MEEIIALVILSPLTCVMCCHVRLMAAILSGQRSALAASHALMAQRKEHEIVLSLLLDLEEGIVHF